LGTITEIIDGCKRRSEKFQAELYNMYSGKMFALCLYYSKNRCEAEDILHDGFISVFQNISQLRDYSLIDFWVPETDEPLYYDNIIEQISAQEISLIIQTLSPQYRIVFNLYAIEGYSHKEIADLLSITESTSKSNLSRARIILQEKIKKEHLFFRSKVASLK